MTTAFSLAPLFRHSVGFDRFNDLFESAARNEAATLPTTLKSMAMTTIASSLPQPVSRSRTSTFRSRKAS
jgi:hypothetical protein